MAVRYLDLDGAVRALQAGRSVEQWLGVASEGEESLLRWVRLDRERDGTFSATVFEVLNDGSPEFLDVYEFTPADVDMPHGQAKAFSSAGDAFAHCVASLGASPTRFVNAGVVQDEYSDYLRGTRSS